jgi:hypothetical protein
MILRGLPRRDFIFRFYDTSVVLNFATSGKRLLQRIHHGPGKLRGIDVRINLYDAYSTIQIPVHTGHNPPRSTMRSL